MLTHTHTRARARVHARTHTRTPHADLIKQLVDMLRDRCAHTLTRTCAHAHTHAHMRMRYVCVVLPKWTHVHVCTRMHTYTHTRCTHVHIRAVDMLRGTGRRAPVKSRQRRRWPTLRMSLRPTAARSPLLKASRHCSPFSSRRAARPRRMQSAQSPSCAATAQPTKRPLQRWADADVDVLAV